MPISRDVLRDTLQHALAQGLYGTVHGESGAIEAAVRAGRMTAEDGVELLRSARYDWTHVPYDNILRFPPHPRYWRIRQDLVRATLRVAQARRWDVSSNRAPPDWTQCTLGDPFDAPASTRPCHIFTYAKTRHGSGWTLNDAIREFRRANSNRYHGTGGTCAILAEEIADLASGQNPVLATRCQALITEARDHHVQKSRHSGMWMPSFQQYCQWWQQIFEVARYTARPRHT